MIRPPPRSPLFPYTPLSRSQERVGDEREEGGPRAEAADERQRDEESEQGEARHRLEHVRKARHGPPPRRSPREQDAQRHSDHDRRTGRDRDQIQVLAYESQDFLRVPGVEFPEPHAAAIKALTSGWSLLRNSSGVPRNASRPCSMSPMRLPSSRPSRTSWVTKTMPLPSRPSSAANSRCSSTRVIGSSAPKGSSSSSSGGSAARARATPTRWRCPPDSSCG